MQGILIALALSVAANVVLGSLWLEQRDDLTTERAEVKRVEGERNTANDVAQACSDSVEELSKHADARAVAASEVREVAAVKAVKHYAKADVILAAPPAVPNDACASAQTLAQDWLKNRGVP